jgi:hypothetical protein
MKLKAIAVTAAAAALSLGMAGSALASPLSTKSKPAPQVTGTRLQSALLPASAFGDGFTVTGHLNAFTETVDNLQLELTTSSLSTTTINKNKAFQLIQYADVAALPVASEYQSTAFVLSGTNVYTIDYVGGTNDPISASLLGTFINRVQALYKHH